MDWSILEEQVMTNGPDPSHNTYPHIIIPLYHTSTIMSRKLVYFYNIVLCCKTSLMVVHSYCMCSMRHPAAQPALEIPPFCFELGFAHGPSYKGPLRSPMKSRSNFWK